MPPFDYLLVGAGLSNGLTAAALATHQPGLRVGLVERSSRMGGNHTWCFHSGDIDTFVAAFLEPFVVRGFASYDVRFPGFERRVEERYTAVTSASFAARLESLSTSGALQVFSGHAATQVEPGRVTLASGVVLEARVVIDARGPAALERASALGFQKFLGLELDVEPSSAPDTPMLMDACVPQTDGFRFFYVVPLSPGRVLVEDTYFSDSKRLDRPEIRREIMAYAASLGLSVRGVAREECGVLPIPSRAVADPGTEHRLVRTGYQGGFFHPTTGYSLELALRVASEVARSTPDDLAERLRRLARTEARQQRYAALLNRLMFRAFAPERRFGALEHFYRLPGPVVRRFYTLSLTGTDRARILCGRPPRGFSLTRLLTPRGSQPFVPKSSGDNA